MEGIEREVIIYKHSYFQTASISKKGGFLGEGGQEVASEYDCKGLEDYLNAMSSDGWEVIGMEPDWYHTEKNISMAMSIVKPIAVVGWYITFKLVEVRT